MENDIEKVCSSCGESKPMAMFHRRAGRPCGYVATCKSCKAKKAGEYRALNVVTCKERSLDWYRENKEKSIATTRAWQAANHERFIKKRDEWRAKQRFPGV